MIRKKVLLLGVPIMVALFFASCKEQKDVYTCSFRAQNDLEDTLFYSPGFEWFSAEPGTVGKLWNFYDYWEGNSPSWDYFLDNCQQSKSNALFLFRYDGQLYLDMGQNEKSVLNPYAFSFDSDNSTAMSYRRNKWVDYEAIYLFHVDQDYLNSLIKIDNEADVENVMSNL